MLDGQWVFFEEISERSEIRDMRNLRDLRYMLDFERLRGFGNRQTS